MDPLGVFVFFFNGRQPGTPVGLDVRGRFMFKGRIKEEFGVFRLELPAFLLDSSFSKKDGLLSFFQGLQDHGPFFKRHIILKFHRNKIMWILVGTFKGEPVWGKSWNVYPEKA